MNSMLPTPTEALQLQKLRTLRVQRAREAVTKARMTRDQAAAAVIERQHRIAAGKQAIDEYAQAMVSTLVPFLARWSGTVTAQRAKLVEHWERETFALGDDRHALKEAEQALRDAAAELGRANAREGISRDLVRDVRRAQAAGADARAELELEDQGRPAVTTGA